jgi:gamma-glutamyltranspeptidase/glutathione hydrolase
MSRGISRRRTLAGAALAAGASLVGCAGTPPPGGSPPVQPEAASGYTDKPGWSGNRFAVAAANPLATEAGDRILKAGGGAIDAAVAVQMVLALVEPQSSGLGGGAFLLHFDGHQVQAFDGRETAPAAARENLFLGADGRPMPFHEAVVGGRAVGVPGAVRMLEMAQRQHGRLPWASLFEPAIRLAQDGFAVSARLNGLLRDDKYLRRDPVAAAYFYNTDGSPRAVGYLLRNPALAEILKTIAANGSRGLLEGAVAQAIVDKVRRHPTNPGHLTLADLAGYQAKVRAPLCSDYQAGARDYRICGFPPPSSGAIAIAQILGILNQTNAATLARQDGLPSAQWLHLYTEASRLAFADRARYVGDPDFLRPPAGSWTSLLAPGYLARRAGLIAQRPDAPALKAVYAGVPGAAQTLRHAPMPAQPEHGTSHISIVDAHGNALAMTTTIEDAFGARQMVTTNAALGGGFLLNNELTDFSFTPADEHGRPVANRVQPGKRPRSSMAPTLVFDKATGQLVMSVGSPGGALIIHFVAKTLYGVLDWHLTPQQAIALPNFGTLGGPLLLEEGRFPAATVQALRARGHRVQEHVLTSGLQAITSARVHGRPGWLRGADPRREGVVMGE